MLIDKLIKTKELMANVQKVNEIKNKLTKLEKNKSDVKVIEVNLTNYNNSMIILFNHDHVRFPKRMLSKEKELIELFIEVINKSGFINKNDLTEFALLINQKDKELQDKWKTYVQEESEHTIHVLKLLKPIIGQKYNIDEVITKIKKLQNKWPMSEQILRMFQENLIRSKEIVKSLGTNNEVEQFIERLIEG